MYGCLATIMILLLNSFDLTTACPADLECPCYSYDFGSTVDCYKKGLGYIPPNIPNDTYYMNLQYNSLLALSLEVPICEIAPELQSFSVGYNSISEIPNHFFTGCYKLENLDFYQNSIFRINPEAFHNVTSLKSLSFQNNRIQAIDVEICKIFPELQTLNLRGNQISELIENSFRGCYNLQILNLYSNRLTKIEPAAFHNLTSLTSLILTYNQIPNMNVEICQLFPNLQSLDISHNSISEILNYTFAGCQTLKSLALTSNQITEIRNDSFTDCLDLTMVDLTSNQIADIHDNAFLESYYLTKLVLAGNKLSSIGELTIRNRTYLSYLDLRSNSISSIHQDAFEGFDSLQTLYLSANILTGNGFDFLRFCKNLYSLYISSNLLTTSDLKYPSLPQLRYMELDKNEIHLLGEELCHAMPELQTLYIRWSHISNISNDFFKKCYNLSSLYLTGNQISEIPDDFFRGNYKLQRLEIDENKFTTVDEESFANISKLSYLNLVNNEVSVIHPEAFQTVPLLYYLYLTNNPLSYGGYAFLQHCSNLGNLRMENTRTDENHSFINKTYLNIMPNLYTLYISNNKLSELDPEIIHNMPNLWELWLQNNRLTEIKANTFRNTTRLYKLYLYGNNISYIEENAFGELPNLKYLYLQSNPLICDCSIASFWKWLKARAESSNYYIRDTYATCSNGTSVFALTSSGFIKCYPSMPVIKGELIQGPIYVLSSPSVFPVLRCTSEEMEEGKYNFDIYWYINGQFVLMKLNQSIENSESTILKDTDWSSDYKLNMEVQCMVRKRNLEDSAPGPAVYSPFFQAGLTPEKYEYTVFEGEHIYIPFTSTLPVGCIASPSLVSGCDQNFFVYQPQYKEGEVACVNDITNREVVFEAEFCGIRLTSRNWTETKYLKVYGFSDGLYNYKDRNTYIRISAKKSQPTNDIWEGIEVPDIKVTVVDKDTMLVNRICQIHNDPHVRTFDGRVYDYMEVGEFVMYKNDRGPYMVHVLFSSCGAGLNGPSCNCGIAIRSKNSLFVFRTCATISRSTIHMLQQPIISLNSCDESDMLIEQTGSSYKVTLPHGTEIKFTTYKWSRFVSGISIKPSVYDLDVSRGLCGVPNLIKDTSDDFTSQQDGLVYNLKSFAESWRVTPEMMSEQLFIETPSFLNTTIGNDYDSLTWTDESMLQRYCVCEKTAGPTDPVEDFYTLHCNLTDTTQFCSEDTKPSKLSPFPTSCFALERNRRSTSAHSRSRRSTSDEGDEAIDFQPLIYADDAFNTDSVACLFKKL